MLRAADQAALNVAFNIASHISFDVHCVPHALLSAFVV